MSAGQPARGLVIAGERRESAAAAGKRVERRRDALGPWSATVELLALTLGGAPRFLVTASWVGPPPTGGQPPDIPGQLVHASECAYVESYQLAEQLARAVEDELRAGRVPDVERLQDRLAPHRTPAPWSSWS